MENDKFTIMRMINDSNTNIKKLYHAIDYITKSSSSPKDAQDTRFLSPDDIKSTFELFFPKGATNKRIYKHGVISFGNQKNMEVEDGLKIIKDILNFYPDYPACWAMHTNIPHRLHGHFILGTRNVFDNTQWQQSKNDLEKFKDHIDSVLQKWKLPLLRRKKMNIRITDIKPNAKIYSHEEQVENNDTIVVDMHFMKNLFPSLCPSKKVELESVFSAIDKSEYDDKDNLFKGIEGWSLHE